MTYQAKLIEEDSWRILLQNLFTVIDQIKDQRSLAENIVKPNSLKKVHDTSFCRIFPVWKQDKDW